MGVGAPARSTATVVGVAVESDALRRRVVAALDGHHDLIAAARGKRPSQLVATADGPSLDVVILAGDASAAKQAAALGELRGRLGAPAIVVTSPGADGARASLAAGAEGVVAADELEAALPAAIRAVRAGQLSLPRSLRPQLEKPVFSSREKQVLGMVVLGFANVEIAGRLHLAESTVKSHLRSAFRKLGVRSRKQAAALILDSEQGLGTGILSISGGRPS